MEKIMSNHVFRNSNHETADTCGNCDGGACESCKVLWLVDGKYYKSHTEAQAAEFVMKEAMASLYKGNFHVEFFFLNDDAELCVKCWDYEYQKNGRSSCYFYEKCETDSPVYEQYYWLAQEAVRKWCECKCVDKHESDGTSNPCCEAGCNDERCYAEMLRGRTEKKWYL